MAKKVKITTKELPFLKRDLNLDEAVLEKLVTAQEEYRKKFKDRLEASQAEALERYTAKVKALKEAKAESLKTYNAEIKKYETLIKDLKGGTKKPPAKGKSSRKLK